MIRREVTLTLALDDELLVDILTTALDPGLGGSLYWMDEIEREQDEDYRTFSARVREEGDILQRWHKISLDTVARGIRLLLNREIEIRQDLLDQVLRGVAEQDAGEIDADAADCIVQAGLFGEVRYG